MAIEYDLPMLQEYCVDNWYQPSHSNDNMSMKQYFEHLVKKMSDEDRFMLWYDVIHFAKDPQLRELVLRNNLRMQCDNS
jgi:hypothetical protein